MRTALVFPILLALFSACRPDPEPVAPLPSGPQTRVVLIADNFQQQSILVVGDAGLGFRAAFMNRLPDGQEGAFRAVQDSLPIVLTDDSGTYWNIWGEAMKGPLAGARLEPLDAMYAYWFAWGAMYPGCSLYGWDDIVSPPPLPADNGWLIPYSRISQGALPGAIPSIDAPTYLSREIEYPDYLYDSTLVLLMQLGGEVFVFPHPVLEWHEIVNDRQGGVPFSLMYCPLTGSGSAWIREWNGEELSFEVSGLLHNSNLLALERGSGSHWSQLLGQAVSGQQSGARARTLQTLEMPFGMVRTLFPRFRVLSDDTGYDWEYGNFPCGDYCTNDNLILYNIHYDDPRLPRKARVFGVVIDGKARVYGEDAFDF